MVDTVVAMGYALGVGRRVLAAWLLLAGSLAVADELPAEIALTGESACPDREQLKQAIQTLLPQFHIADDVAPTGQIDVRVDDQGDRYLVRLGAAKRLLNDPARQCEERARGAAVVVALILQPPVVPAPPPPSDRPKRPRIRFDWDLEATGLVEGAPATKSVVGGGQLRLLAGRSYAALFLGVAGTSPFSFALDEARVRITRVPIDLGARLSLRRGRVELGGELSLVGTVLQLQGEGLPAINVGTRFELGARLGLVCRVWLTQRVGFVLGPELLVSFRPTELSVIPDGVVGTTPRFWVGGSLGLAFRISRAR